jgi:hypothetical protein
MRLIALACAVSSIAVLVLGCAAEPVADTNVAGDGDMVCKREYPTGSNIPVTKCRTRAQIEAEKTAANESLRRTTIGGSVKGTN